MRHLPLTRSRPQCRTLEERLAPATLPSGFVEAALPATITGGTAMAVAPDGRLFVCEEGGNVRVFTYNGTSWALSSANFLANTPVTTTITGERGLLGIAFDPNYATNRYAYFYYTATTPTTHNRIIRVTGDATGIATVAGSTFTLMDLPTLSATNHNGGAIHFGADGKLYAAVGDNAVSANAQSMTTVFGKMLRMNTDGTAPNDNPFFGSTTGINQTIWALGLRNPFTFAFRPGTNFLYINDVGEVTWEEINPGIAGANYGWPSTEGRFNQASFPTYTNPLVAYHHTNGALNYPAGSTSYTGFAIAGGAFYNPTQYVFPSDYVGDYFYADYINNIIRRFDATENATYGFATGAGNPVDLTVGPDGSLFYLSRTSSAVFQVRYTGATAPYIVTHPASPTTNAGQAVTFSAVAGGPGTLSYQWQRNNVNIPGATSSSYTLTNPAGADNGATFRVVVTNASGNVTSNAGTLTVIPGAPVKVTSVQVDDGSAQRSMVRSLTVNFDGIVTYASTATAAFSLIGPGGAVPFAADPIDNTSGDSVIRLTFSPASLPTGDYSFTVFGGQFRDDFNRDIDGDGNGSTGGDYPRSFHRLFGDIDGDRDVDLSDFVQFKAALGSTGFGGAYNFAFDLDGDGDVDLGDFAAFKGNLGVTI